MSFVANCCYEILYIICLDKEKREYQNNFITSSEDEDDPKKLVQKRRRKRSVKKEEQKEEQKEEKKRSNEKNKNNTMQTFIYIFFMIVIPEHELPFEKAEHNTKLSTEYKAIKTIASKAATLKKYRLRSELMQHIKIVETNFIKTFKNSLLIE